MSKEPIKESIQNLVKAEIKKDNLKDEAKFQAKEQAKDRLDSRADTGGPPLEGGGGGQVQEFYPLGAGSEVIPPTPEEVADAVNNEAGK